MAIEIAHVEFGSVQFGEFFYLTEQDIEKQENPYQKVSKYLILVQTEEGWLMHNAISIETRKPLFVPLTKEVYIVL